MLDPKKPEIVIFCAKCNKGLMRFQVNSCQGKVVSTRQTPLQEGMPHDIDKLEECPSCGSDYRDNGGNFKFRTKDGVVGVIPAKPQQRRPSPSAS